MSDQKQAHGEFCWNELMTSDPKKAKAFYSGLLGWSSEDIDMEGMTYTMFKNADKEIAGMLQTPDDMQGEVPSHWMSYINVNNLDESIKQVVELGGEIIDGPIEVGEFGVFAVIEDPTGAHVALWEQLKKC